MRPRLAWGLLLGMVVCASLALWSAVPQLQAKRCLVGDLRPDTNGASITEQGCEITTISGKTVFIPIDGPPLEVGVASVFGFLVLALLLAIVLIRRAGTPSSRQS
jgi:hypothetical protein